MFFIKWFYYVFNFICLTENIQVLKVAVITVFLYDCNISLKYDQHFIN